MFLFHKSLIKKIFNIYDNFLTERNFSRIFATLAGTYLVTAIIGGYRYYTPIPLGDMWDSYLRFYMLLGEGDWAQWFSQHNEHRIFFAKILFWIDLKIFNGTVWFLIVMNYVIIALTCVLMIIINKRHSQKTNDPINYFIVAIMFSWLQQENLTWGFQSQFFLAQALPLLSFYLLHRAAADQRVFSNYFLFASGFGFITIGTMANGVLVLPLMVLYALIMKFDKRQILSLTALSVISITLYFYDYRSPGGHGSVKDALLNSPIDLLRYTFIYIGSPFYHAVGKGSFGLVVATLAGLALASTSAFIGWGALKKRQSSSLTIAMIFFLIYIGATAFGTGGGRLIFGVDQALASRYTTPSIMAWVVLLILVANSKCRFFDKSLRLMLIGLLVALLPTQLKALSSINTVSHNRELATLALALQIKDDMQIHSIYPSAEWALLIAKEANEQNVSIFSMSPFMDLKEKMGTQYPSNVDQLPNCEGSVDAIQLIQNEKSFLKFTGQFHSSVNGDEVLTVVDQRLKVIGFALTRSADQSEWLPISSNHHGYLFSGYVEDEAQGNLAYIISDTGNCKIDFRAPKVPVSLSSKKPQSSDVNISSESIVGLNEWTGSGVHSPDFSNIEVFSSFIQSDQDIGSVSLRVKQGDKLIFHSPSTDKQYIYVSEAGDIPITLPRSFEWRLLEFGNSFLPDEFIITFSDEGTTLGEWSSIGLINENGN